MKIITKIVCTVCGKETEIIEFSQRTGQFPELIGECKCGTELKARAMKANYDKNKDELSFQDIDVMEIRWLKRKRKLLNPSERY